MAALSCSHIRQLLANGKFDIFARKLIKPTSQIDTKCVSKMIIRLNYFEVRKVIKSVQPKLV